MNKILDIRPKKNPHENCFDNNIVSAAACYWNKKYLPYHLCDFQFDILYGYDTIRKIKTSYPVSFNIFEICTQKRIVYCCPDKIEIVSLLISEISNNQPVGIMTCDHDCSWISEKSLALETHFVLAVGFDDLNFYIADGYITDEIINVSYNDLLKLAKEVLIFAEIDTKPTDIREIWQLIISEIYKADSNIRYNRINEFANYIENSNFELQVRDIKDTNVSTIVSFINDIINARINFYNSLIFFKEPLAIENGLTDLLQDIITHWKTIKIKYLKSLLFNYHALYIDAIQIVKQVSEKEKMLVSLINKQKI